MSDQRTESSSRFERYVRNLSDEDALILHRIVCRRAAHIYEPRYRAKREANFRTAQGYMNAHRAAATRSSSSSPLV